MTVVHLSCIADSRQNKSPLGRLCHLEKNDSCPTKLTSPAPEKQKVVPPTSPAGSLLLQMILEHPIPQERGLTEILTTSHQPTMAHFIPNTTAAGAAPSFKKSVLRAASLNSLNLVGCYRQNRTMSTASMS